MCGCVVYAAQDVKNRYYRDNYRKIAINLFIL